MGLMKRRLIRQDELDHISESLSLAIRQITRDAQIRAYLPTGAWDKARETLEAAEKWQADVAEGQRLLIEQARREG